MKLYLSVDRVSYSKIAIENGISAFMLSYNYKISKKTEDFLKSQNILIMMDSGAFTAWTSNKEILIDSYIDYIKKFNPNYFITLDVIGDSDKSWDNQKYIESKGINPMPVFHFGEDVKYLDRIMNSYENPYVCLGGSVGQSRKKREYFFDMCFNKYPNAKFHALGMTDYVLMAKFPWESVDSSSWLSSARYRTLKRFNGSIEMPKEMPLFERLDLSAKFFYNIEKIINSGKGKSLYDGTVLEELPIPF